MALKDKMTNEVEKDLGEGLTKLKENGVSLEDLLSKGELSIAKIAQIWPDKSVGELIKELSSHGLKMTISKEDSQDASISKNSDEVSLVGEIPDTLENKERYLENREMAREKMGESGMIESYLEDANAETSEESDSIDQEALNALNTASYEGDFGELPSLSENLKKM